MPKLLPARNGFSAAFLALVSTGRNLEMGVSATVELEGLSVRTKHEEPGLRTLQAADLGQGYALSLRLGLEGRPACPRHRRHDLVIVARAEQGRKQARVAANGLFGRRR